MPEIKLQWGRLVSRYVQRLWTYRHKFNASQKSVILLVLLCSAAVPVLHWLHVCVFLSVYVGIVHFTVTRCNAALGLGELYRSEIILKFISNVKDAAISVLNLFERDSRGRRRRDGQVAETGPLSAAENQAERSYSVSSEKEILSDDDSSFHTDENKVNDEIERFLNLVMRDFIQSWYKTLSTDPDVVEEIHEILYQAAIQLYQTRLTKLNVKKVVCDVTKLYQQHLNTVIVCKSILKSRPKRRRSSSSWVSSLEEAYQQKYGFHAALEDESLEINYVRSLVDVVLVRLLPIQIHRCRIARALVTEILACNLMLPLIDMMSSTEWIHKAMKEVFSDDSKDLNEAKISSLTFSEMPPSDSENDVFSNSDQHSDDKNSVSRKPSRSSNSSRDYTYRHSVNYGIQTEPSSNQDLCNSSVPLTSKTLKTEERLLCTKQDQGPHLSNQSNSASDLSVMGKKTFTLKPHEEITVSNIPEKEKSPTFRRHSIIGAADLAEEAGEVQEEREPPNGKAAASIFTECGPRHSIDVGTMSMSRLNMGKQTLKRPQSQVYTSGLTVNFRDTLHEDDEEDLTIFKDAQPEYNLNSKVVNGLSGANKSDEMHEDEGSQFSLPMSLISPSLKPKSVILSECGQKLNTEIMSHSLIAADVTHPTSAPQDIAIQSTTLPDNVSQSFSATGDSGSTRIKASNSPPGDSTLKPTEEGGKLSGDEPVRGQFYLPDDDVEDAVGAESDIQFSEPHENWAHLARNIPNSNDIESALANCRTEGKPDEYKVLECKPYLFHSVSIPTTDTIAERGTAAYTVYKIEFEAWYWSDGEVVLRKGSVLRRFREFVNLQARLEDNAAYKSSMKDVKGPKRWMSLPFGNMDKNAVEGRRKYLERFLKGVIEKEVMCNGEELREFLAYEGRSHIAFVRKAPELTVPRIDKMFVKTVSGMFDRIATVLPTLTPDVLPSLSRKESTAVVKVTEEGSTLDEDSIELIFGFVQNQQQRMAFYEKFTEDYLQRIEQDEMPTNPQLQSGTNPNVGSESVVGLTDFGDRDMDQIPRRSEGDGSATPDPPISQGLDKRSLSEIPLAKAVLDLGAQALQMDSWVCRESVMNMIQILFGRALDRWLEEQVNVLTSSEQCCVYMALLRETIWPKGKLLNEDEPVLSDIEKIKRKDQAKKSLKEFFPDLLVGVIGDGDLEEGVSQIMESVENQKLNRHFLYTLIDLILECLFPELTNQVNVPQRT